MTFGNNDPAKQRKRSLKSNWRHGPACDGKRASESFARYCERGAPSKPKETK